MIAERKIISSKTPMVKQHHTHTPLLQAKAEPTIRCRNGRQIRRSSVDVTARCFKKCVLRNSSSEWLISCWKKNLNRVTGLSTTLQHVCTQHVCPHLGLSWYFWSRARVLERLHFEGDEEKTFLKNGVTAQLFFAVRIFWFWSAHVAVAYGSCHMSTSKIKNSHWKYLNQRMDYLKKHEWLSTECSTPNRGHGHFCGVTCHEHSPKASIRPPFIPQKRWLHGKS